MSKRNPVAKSLRSPHLRPRVVKPKKGRGSYSRKNKEVPRMMVDGASQAP